jgi:hypothetical protein
MVVCGQCDLNAFPTAGYAASLENHLFIKSRHQITTGGGL